MTRREDTEWGATIAEAKRAADFTCSYANAAPQVPTLNRAPGDWGTLEKEYLEKALLEEEQKEPRIVVFSGPIFDDDDPVFKGVQVATSFFKVIVWRGAANKLKTTCWRLTQEDVLEEIEFEALHLDDVFKEQQVSLAMIESLRGLSWTETVRAADT
jgi:endonuclease G, mitochondrial